MSRETGPNAYSHIALFNQHVWDAYPEKARDAALEALHTGGFYSDCIDRQVGNYEGEIMAIRAGWVDLAEYGWRINEAGRNALRDASIPEPHFLPAYDDWHSRKNAPKIFDYCAYKVERGGEPMLRLFKEAIPCGSRWGMDPLLRRQDAEALRDFLDDWLKAPALAKAAE